MYDHIMLTALVCVLLWMAVSVTVAAYILRRIFTFKEWFLSPPRVSDVMPPRKAFDLSVSKYVVARVGAFVIIRYISKKLR